MKLKNVIKIGIVPFCALTLLGCKRGGDGTKVTVTFRNYDGTILQTEKIERGQDASYKQEEIPSKPIIGSEVANVFMGWDKPLTNIRSNTVYNAVYKKLDKFIDKDHDGMPEGVDPNDDPNDKSSNYFFVNAKSMVNLDQEIVIDFSKFLKSEMLSTYDNELAKLGLFLSNPKIDFKDGLFSDKAYGGRINALYSRLGFDDFHHFDFRKNDYKYDPNDTTSGVYGHKYLYDDEGNIKKDLIVIAFDGTHGSSRWSSNFDIGYDSEIYYKKMQRSDKDYEKGTADDHPEWNNKNYHKGFYVAAKRVLADKVDDGTKEGPVKFLEYIKNHSKYGEPVIFVTGHSRGGAMANLVGQYLDKNRGDNKWIPVTYAFASPCVWGGGSSRPQTQSIFNIINNDDIVTMVPHTGWGFDRLGNDTVGVSIENNSTLKEAYNKNKEGREYQLVKNGVSIFANLGCEGRQYIYDLDYVKENEPMYLSDTELSDRFDTTETQKADDAKKEIEAVYTKTLGDYSKFLKFGVYTCYTLLGTPYLAVKTKCCIGSVTAAVQRVMGGDKEFTENIFTWLPLLLAPEFKEMIFELLPNLLIGGADTVALPHDYGSYHVILRYHEEKK